MELVIGNRQWSSWSLRAWLALRHLGISFRTTMTPLRTDRSAALIAGYSPSGKVPVLLDGDTTVWDSLAICEYGSELAAGRGWPTDAARRAHARSVSAEMHSGFAALRHEWPMEAATVGLDVSLSADARRDTTRVAAIFEDCRRRYAADGPWLFGVWSIADAMYAPVALRFRTYGAALSPGAGEYLSTVIADRELGAWLEAARLEASR